PPGAPPGRRDARGAARRLPVSPSPDHPLPGRWSTSYTPIPASIARVKTAAFSSPAPRATSAGPGQNPARPQPMPKPRLPSTRGRSMSRRVGTCRGAPSRDRARLPAKPKPTRPTATAPPITSAREGSQAPARSRNPSTLAGLAMPEVSSPRPNSSPTANADTRYLFMSASQYMADDVDGDKAAGHEGQGRHQGAGGEPRQAADPVAAGATGAVAGADADQQSRGDQQRVAGVDGDGRQGTGQPPEQRRHQDAGHEGQAPGDVPGPGPQQPAEDAGNPRDAAIEKDEQHRGEAYQKAPQQRGQRGEGGPVNCHG